jgi:hypothetical protein
MSPVRLLARMTPDHRNGTPRQSDGSVGWSMPGASARVWPDGRIEFRSTTGAELAGQLEGSEWDQWKVAAVADAGLRLLCAPEARHLTRTGQPSGWHRPFDRRESAGLGRERKGGQMYDGSTVASYSCGWRVTAESQLGACALAEQHRREATSGEPSQPPTSRLRSAPTAPPAPKEKEAPSCPDPYRPRRPRRPLRLMTTAGASTAACPAPSR